MTESSPAGEPVHKLNRSRDDRFIGGVAAGLANRFNIDPVLVRLAFVASLAFGGIGAIGYLVLLVTLPIAGDPAEPVPPISQTRRIAVIAGTIVLGIVILATGGSGWLFGFSPGALFGIIFWTLVVLGLIWLIREGMRGNQPDSFSEVSPSQSAPAPTATAAVRSTPEPATAETETLAATGPEPETAESGASVIGRAITFIAVGLTLLVLAFMLVFLSSWVTVITGAIPMAVLTAGIGVAMVVLAVNDRRRIALWLLPVALCIAVPMAAFSLAGIRLHGGYGDIRETPRTVGAIPAEGYRLAAGQMTIDMRKFNFRPGRTVNLPVDSGFGFTQVIVPDDVCVAAKVTGKAGAADILGSKSSGPDISHKISSPPGKAPRLRLRADFDLGFFQVLDSTTYRSSHFFGFKNYRNGYEERGSRESDKQRALRATRACAAAGSHEA